MRGSLPKAIGALIDRTKHALKRDGRKDIYVCGGEGPYTDKVWEEL